MLFLIDVFESVLKGWGPFNVRGPGVQVEKLARSLADATEGQTRGLWHFWSCLVYVQNSRK